MLLYRLTFEAGAEIVTFHTIKNFKIGAHIASVINSNFPYFNKDHSSVAVLMIYDKNGKPIHHHHNNKDVIGDGCTYFVRRQSVKRSSRSSKKYWRR